MTRAMVPMKGIEIATATGIASLSNRRNANEPLLVKEAETIEVGTVDHDQVVGKAEAEIEAHVLVTGAHAAVVVDPLNEVVIGHLNVLEIVRQIASAKDLQVVGCKEETNLKIAPLLEILNKVTNPTKGKTRIFKK